MLWLLLTHEYFISHLPYPRDSGDRLLGNLFLVEGRQAASQEEDAVGPLARDLPDGKIGTLVQTLRRRLPNSLEKGRIADNRLGIHKVLSLNGGHNAS